MRLSIACILSLALGLAQIVADDAQKPMPTQGVLLEFVEVRREDRLGALSLKAIIIEFENSEFSINERFFCDPYTAKGARGFLYQYLTDKDNVKEYRVHKEGDNKLYIEGFVDPSTKKFHPVKSVKWTSPRKTDT